MEFNWLMLFVAALIPLLVGAVYYHPKIAGAAWMRASGLPEESLKGANMALVFGLSYLLGLFMALALAGMVIHQAHLYSIFLNEPGMNDPNSEVSRLLSGLMEKYGRNFRTFGHGAFHGTAAALCLIVPVFGINALFERKNLRYVAINCGYWILTAALMGGVLCAYL